MYPTGRRRRAALRARPRGGLSLIRWLPASYARDVLVPLVVLGASLSIAFVVLTQESVAEVEPDERVAASQARARPGPSLSPRRRSPAAAIAFHGGCCAKVD